MFKIVSQVEKTGKTEKTVLVKRVKMFPEMQQGQVVGFGMLKCIVLSMKLKRGKDVFTMTWSNTGGPEGRFSFRMPDFKGPQYQRDSGNNRIAVKNGIKIIDPTKPPMIYKGESTRYDDRNAMAVDLLNMTGKDMAVKIIKLFGERMTDVLARAKANAEKKAAKAAKANA